MWSRLAGVPGKLASLKTVADSILAKLTGNVDVNVSTRAAASTALSNAVWTDPKAAFVDAAISTRARFRVQTGYVSSSTSVASGSSLVTTGTGEDLKYVDVTLSAAVSDIDRAIVEFEGGAASSGNPAASLIRSGLEQTAKSYVCTYRLTSTTNLRISCAGTGPTGEHAPVAIAGRWRVIDPSATT